MKNFYVLKKSSTVLFLLLILSWSTKAQNNASAYLTDNNYVEAPSSVPDDWKNDLWLNTDFVELSIGDNYIIAPRRVPEIIDNPISNAVVLPPFNFRVVEGNSATVADNGTITAHQLGKTVIKVTYDPIDAYSQHYEAVSPVNVTYVVVNVVDENVKEITIETDLTSTSYDTYYFEEDNYMLPLGVTTKNATSVEVTCNGNKVDIKENKYPLPLENRANIIEIKASNNNTSRIWSTVIDARKIEIQVENITHPGAPITIDDKIQIGFKGIVLPVYKLATIYNPQMPMGMWGGEFTKVTYVTDEGKKLSSNDPKLGQYNLATDNKIIFKAEQFGTINLTQGHIRETWWGSPLGSDKIVKGQGKPNLSAPTLEGNFSTFPDIHIDVLAPYRTGDFEDIEVPAQGYTMPKLNGYTETSKTYETGSYSFRLNASDFGTIFPVWSGTIVTTNNDNISEGGVQNQLNSAAGGDIDGTGKYAVSFLANSGGMKPSKDHEVRFTITNPSTPRVIKGCYVTNNTYAVHSMENGDQFAKKFGGEDGTDPDWMLLTAEGLNEKDQVVGTTEFYLGDFRFEDPEKDYIVKDWQWFDLSSLGEVTAVRFKITSSDVGQYGMNTPAYFCLDNLDQPRLEFKGTTEEIRIEDDPKEIDLSSWFTDTEGDNITIDITNHCGEDLTTSIENNILTINRNNKQPFNGEISIKATCQKMSKVVNLKVNAEISTSFNDLETNSSTISFYPNPAIDIITVNGLDTFSKHHFRVLDLTGKVVLNGALDTNNQFNVSNLHHGIYLLQIDNNKHVLKLIKK
ncbi:MAG: DUF4465 domain-containing protein [Prolixibacteraceae bacterium]|jgi:hypothetical protein|nr:DUF4465 domain-containing protein [Prolixibacteraceae bacterium]